MPTYDYKCTVCGHVEEVLRPALDVDAPFTCPDCGAPCVYVWRAPHVMWFYDQTRSPFKEKRRHH
jgi:putative FmdB family regulatory protein